MIFGEEIGFHFSILVLALDQASSAIRRYLAFYAA
jgi:hypothetical protein